MPRIGASSIAESLRDRIESGEWADGRRIPPERELAEHFGVARNTIRKAIDMLGANVTLTRAVGRGTFLEGAGDPPLGSVIRRMEGASPADMMEIRLLLEPAAAAFAATNASSAELARVFDAHREAVAATAMPEFERWDSELHHRIFSCSRNELLREMHNVLRLLRNQPAWFEMKQRSFSEPRRTHYCAEHQVLVDALVRRDPDGARGAMQMHLKTVEANLLGR
jgi:GntR family transcriptional regulator, hexuronate regulon transcriptional repressor